VPGIDICARGGGGEVDADEAEDVVASDVPSRDIDTIASVFADGS